MALTYHKATAVLLDRPLLVSTAAQATLDEREAALSIRFPAAVREWYSLGGAVATLEEYSNSDSPVLFGELGAVVRYWDGSGPQDLVSDGFLVFLNENQGVAQWSVRLDGTNDPEVLVRADDGLPTGGWRHCANRFSTFIYTRVRDFGSWASGTDCYVLTQDRPLAHADLRLLRNSFSEGPRTHGWPGRTSHRFSAGDGRILICDDEEGQADWMLWAPSVDALTRLVARVWWCGALARELYAIGECGKTVLSTLRQQFQC